MPLVLISVIAFTTSLVSGMLGLGGAVLLIPAYLYVPHLFGLGDLGVRNISGMTSVQVLAASLVGMLTHKRRGTTDTRLALTMGIPITAASLTGAIYSTAVNADVLVGVFASMAVVGAALMVASSDRAEAEGRLEYSAVGAVAIAVGVGFFGGMVGAPGAFLLSPLMMTVLKIPTRVTIGTMLAVVLMSALAASVGKLATGQVPLLATAIAVAASLPGVYLGSRLSYRLKTQTLRRALAMVILAVGAEMWYQILFSAAGSAR